MRLALFCVVAAGMIIATFANTDSAATGAQLQVGETTDTGTANQADFQHALKGNLVVDDDTSEPFSGYCCASGNPHNCASCMPGWTCVSQRDSAFCVPELRATFTGRAACENKSCRRGSKKCTPWFAMCSDPRPECACLAYRDCSCCSGIICGSTFRESCTRCEKLCQLQKGGLMVIDESDDENAYANCVRANAIEIEALLALTNKKFGALVQGQNAAQTPGQPHGAPSSGQNIAQRATPSGRGACSCRRDGNFCSVGYASFDCTFPHCTPLGGFCECTC